MKIVREGETLNVSEILELATANSRAFQAELHAALPLEVSNIDIDLSQTGFLDCGGVGALVALRNCARRQNAKLAIRLVNPGPHARQIIELTRMDRVFPIVLRE